MFCDNCGNQINGSSQFCDKCGKPLADSTSVVGFVKFLKEKLNLKNLSVIEKRNLLIFAILLIFGAFSLMAYTKYSKNQQYLYSTLQKQSEQTSQLENQLNDVKKQAEAVQQQNASTTKALASQLDTQKAETANAEKQAQLAQQALSVVKQQAQSAPTNSSFPTINSRAIVLVVCADSSGNVQSGSGTIINPEGYVLTNKHVVTDDYGGSLTCGVFMNDGSAAPQLQKNTLYSLTLYAPSAGYYNNYDAALLKINGATDTQTNNSVNLPSPFPFITPQGGNLKQGDQLYIFGYPAASNLVFNVTRGIVSSFSADNTFINTDAVIDHGDSGGAAITSDGRFIGIPTQKYVANSDYSGQILRVEDLVIPN